MEISRRSSEGKVLSANDVFETRNWKFETRRPRCRFPNFDFPISIFQNGPDFGLICGTRRGSLPLLPSGPGGVHEHPSHRARSLTTDSPLPSHRDESSLRRMVTRTVSPRRFFSSQLYTSPTRPYPTPAIHAILRA